MKNDSFFKPIVKVANWIIIYPLVLLITSICFGVIYSVGEGIGFFIFGMIVYIPLIFLSNEIEKRKKKKRRKEYQKKYKLKQKLSIKKEKRKKTKNHRELIESVISTNIQTLNIKHIHWYCNLDFKNRSQFDQAIASLRLKTKSFFDNKVDKFELRHKNGNLLSFDEIYEFLDMKNKFRASFKLNHSLLSSESPVNFTIENNYCIVHQIYSSFFTGSLDETFYFNGHEVSKEKFKNLKKK